MFYAVKLCTFISLSIICTDFTEKKRYIFLSFTDNITEFKLYRNIISAFSLLKTTKLLFQRVQSSKLKRLMCPRKCTRQDLHTSSFLVHKHEYEHDKITSGWRLWVTIWLLFNLISTFAFITLFTLNKCTPIKILFKL